MDKLYFKLYPDVMLVNGDKRSTLHLLSNKQTIPLSIAESELLKCLTTKSMDLVEQEYDKVIIENALELMLQKGLGNIYSSDVYIEPVLFNLPFELDGLLDPILIIQELSIELDCDDSQMQLKPENILFQPCYSCIPSPQFDIHNPLINVCDIMFGLNQIKNVQIKRVKIHCSDMQKNWEILNELMRYIRDTFAAEILIVTSWLNFSSHIISEMITLNASICYNFSNERFLLHESETEKSIKYLVRKGIPVSVNIVLHSDNNDSSYTKMREIINGWDVAQVYATEILDSKNSQISIYPRGIDRIEDIDFHELFFRSQHNPCLYGKIGIDRYGNVRPCLHSKHCVGHIEKMFEIFEHKKHEKYWSYSKTKISRCNKCENRFACTDCFLMEDIIEQSPATLKMICEYEPDTGHWYRIQDDLQNTFLPFLDNHN